MDDYVVQNSEHGRGVFVTRDMPAGAVLLRYDGERKSVASLPQNAPRTHMLRLRGTDDVIDGLDLADNLFKCARTGLWKPLEPERFCWSYGALANAATTEGEANARLVFLTNDTTKASAAAAKLFAPIPFLVAKRKVVAGEEVLWHYAWQ